MPEPSIGTSHIIPSGPISVDIVVIRAPLPTSVSHSPTTSIVYFPSSVCRCPNTSSDVTHLGYFVTLSLLLNSFTNDSVVITNRQTGSRVISSTTGHNSCRLLSSATNSSVVNRFSEHPTGFGIHETSEFLVIPSHTPSHNYHRTSAGSCVSRYAIRYPAPGSASSKTYHQ